MSRSRQRADHVFSPDIRLKPPPNPKVFLVDILVLISIFIFLFIHTVDTSLDFMVLMEMRFFFNLTLSIRDLESEPVLGGVGKNLTDSRLL